MKTKLLIIIPVIIILSILAVLVYDSVTLDRVCQDSGGKRTGNTCLVPIAINSAKNDSQSAISQSQIKIMKTRDVGDSCFA